MQPEVALPQAPLNPPAPVASAATYTPAFPGRSGGDGSLISGYLSAERLRSQPLCGNAEGWGPLSPIRYDFTPCFLDVWIAAVATAGIVAGAGAALYLLRRRSLEPVKRNWHFYGKLVRVFPLLG